MSLDARTIRRGALVVTASLLLAGCAPAATDGSAPAGSATDRAAAASTADWSAVLDADAPFLNLEGEEGAAMPGDCWVQLEDGTIQVQVAGSSIPEPEVERVDYADGVMTLVMKTPGEDTPATMDLVLHQVMVKPADGAEVKSVHLVRGEDEVELERGVIAPEQEPTE